MNAVKTPQGNLSDANSYKPQELRKLVGIDQSKFDYWKKALSLSQQDELYDGDVLGYKIIKESVVGYRLSVAGLKQFDWNLVFSACHEIDPESLVKCRFVFDLVDSALLFLGPEEDDPSPRKRSQLCPIYMDEMFDELYETKRKWHQREDVKVVDHEEFKIAKFSKKIKDTNLSKK